MGALTVGDEYKSTLSFAVLKALKDSNPRIHTADDSESSTLTFAYVLTSV